MATKRAEGPQKSLTLEYVFSSLLAPYFLIANPRLKTLLNHPESMRYNFLIANNRRFLAAIHSFFHSLLAVKSASSVLIG